MRVFNAKSNKTGSPVFKSGTKIAFMGLVLIAICFYSWWLIKKTSDQLEDDFKQDAQTILSSINLDRLKALSGTESDLHSANYLRLKEQLTRVKKAYGKSPHIYFLRCNPDGKIFSIIDNSNSTDAHLPEDEVKNTPKEILNIFNKNDKSNAPIFFPSEKNISITIPVFATGVKKPDTLFIMNLDAVSWNATIFKTVALPIGLFSALALLVLVSIFSGDKRAAAPIMLYKRPQLLILMTILVVILIAFCVMFIRTQLRSLNQSTGEIFRDVHLDFKQLLVHQANSITVMEDIILRDKALRTAMKTGDRKRLIQIYSPLFAELKKNYGITHFYFIRPDCVTLLRLHKPDKYGDKISRFTLKEAERTSSTVSGIELGPLGTFTLRVVKPVYMNNKLVGYLELGKEIEDTLSLIRNKYDVQLMVAINKNELDRTEWQAGMKMLGRNVDWDMYSNSVIIYSSLVSPPADVNNKLIKKLHQDNRFITNLKFDGKSWSIIMQPLIDVTGKSVGGLIIFKDVSKDVQALVHLFILLIGIVALVVIALMVLLFLIHALRKANQDIHRHQQELAFSEKRFRDVAEGISDWIWELNTDMEYTFVSSNITRELGYAPDEILGKTPFEIMKPEEVEYAEAAFTRMTKTGNKLKDFINWKIRKDGSTACMLTNVLPMLDDNDKLQGYRGSDKDVTNQVLAERELKKAKEAAECASIAKSEFLTMMSHEIRTPLNGLIGFADIIGETIAENSCCEQRDEIIEYVKIIKTCGMNLTELMNDMLDLASIEAGKENILVDEFSPEQIIEESLEILNFKSKEKNVEVVFQPENLPPLLIGAKKRLKQIVFNLVGNAIKFTGKGKVVIKAQFKKDHLWVEVKDNGIGIPEDMKEKILEPFTQVDQTSTRKYGGTGLGLTIVSKNLEILGGTLDIDSKLGKGTTVTFTFPAKISGDLSSNTQRQEYSALQPACNILVIEDNEISVLYLKKILSSSMNHKIVMSFAEMKEVCDHGFIPDVVLIDISLPDADGFECLKWLKKKFSGTDIKYIAQTAHVLREETARYKQEGFDSFIGKPYKKTEFISVINRVLEKNS